jgi:hypothetical protein
VYHEGHTLLQWYFNHSLIVIGSAKWINGYIQLTANKTDQCGSFFAPLHDRPSKNFFIEVGFKMTSQGADGMVCDNQCSLD